MIDVRSSWSIDSRGNATQIGGEPVPAWCTSCGAAGHISAECELRHDDEAKRRGAREHYAKIVAMRSRSGARRSDDDVRRDVITALTDRRVPISRDDLRLYVGGGSVRTCAIIDALIADGTIRISKIGKRVRLELATEPAR